MHRPLLCGIMCAYVCFVSKRVFCFFVRVCLRVCVWTRSCATVQSPCQPNQSQPELTGTGERVSLAHSRHATPLLYTALGWKNLTEPPRRDEPACVSCSRTKQEIIWTPWLMMNHLQGWAWHSFKKDAKDPSVSIWRQLSNNASICCASNANQVHTVSLLLQWMCHNKWVTQRKSRQVLQPALEKTTYVNMRKWKASYMHAICAESCFVLVHHTKESLTQTCEQIQSLTSVQLTWLNPQHATVKLCCLWIAIF